MQYQYQSQPGSIAPGLFAIVACAGGVLFVLAVLDPIAAPILVPLGYELVSMAEHKLAA